MPSQTFIVRAHARTIHTRPITFVCAKCDQMTTRECYPGKAPKYCLECAPARKKDNNKPVVLRGSFHPTHYLVSAKGKKTEICLEKANESGWYWVRTALDWFSGDSIIRYHQHHGIYSYNQPLEGYSLESIPEELIEKDRNNPENTLETITEQGYSMAALCRRFNCGYRLMSNMRSRPDFPQWSQSRDPDGYAWEYRDERFFLQEDNPPISLENLSTDTEKGYSMAALCRRFKCGYRLMSNMRSRADFPQWSQSRDPDGYAWEYRQGQYFRIKDYDYESENNTFYSPQPDPDQPYSMRQLCRRFKCGYRLMKNMLASPNFPQWSQSRDPDGYAWEYRQDKFFLREA